MHSGISACVEWHAQSDFIMDLRVTIMPSEVYEFAIHAMYVTHSTVRVKVFVEHALLRFSVRCVDDVHFVKCYYGCVSFVTCTTTFFFTIRIFEFALTLFVAINVVMTL